MRAIATIVFYLFLPALLANGFRRRHSDYRRQHSCFPITDPLCIGFGYSATTMPNILKHDTEAEASRRLREFEPLIGTGCSEYLRFFLCSLHFPMCVQQVTVPITSCQLMCKEVRSKCSPIMKSFSVDWPDSIDCEQLPRKEDENVLCMQPPTLAEHNNSAYERNGEKEHRKTYESANKEHGDSTPPTHIGDDVIARESKLEVDHKDETKFSNFGLEESTKYQPRVEVAPNLLENDINTYQGQPLDTHQGRRFPDLRSDLNKPAANEFDDVTQGNRVNTSNQCENPLKFLYSTRTKECIPRCETDTDVLFSNEHKWFAYWLCTIFASLCFISSGAAVLTFAIDRKRFSYPVRPIAFISLCYCLYSSAYLIRSLRGPYVSISCTHSADVEGAENIQHMAKSGLGGTECTAVFFILYYFGMAASAWWVTLTVTWFLSAGFKWGNEAIAAYGFYFHLICWSLPAALTVAVLMLGKVDGDELTGLCYVGNLDRDSLMYFVIIPLTFYLLTGTVALTFGFGYLFKIRRVIKHQCDKSAFNLEKLMFRIGLFSLLYTVPAACVLGANFYQYQNSSEWFLKAQGIPCKLVPVESSISHESRHGFKDYSNFVDYVPPSDELIISEPATDFGAYSFSDLRSHYEEAVNSEAYSLDAKQDRRFRYRSVKERELANAKTRVLSKTVSDSAEYMSHFTASHEQKNTAAGNLHPHQASILDCSLQQSIASLPIFAIKIFMSLLAGIASGMWIWSAKTVVSWRKFCYGLRNGRRDAAALPYDKQLILSQDCGKRKDSNILQLPSGDLGCQQPITVDDPHSCQPVCCHPSHNALSRSRLPQNDNWNTEVGRRAYVQVPCVRSKSQIFLPCHQPSSLYVASVAKAEELKILPVEYPSLAYATERQSSGNRNAAFGKVQFLQHDCEKLGSERFCGMQCSTTPLRVRSNDHCSKHIVADSRCDESKLCEVSENFSKHEQISVIATQE